MNCWLILHFSIGLLLLFAMLCATQHTSFRERAKKYCRLSKNCSIRAERNYDYKKLMKISDILGAQPPGYLVQLQFYVMAPRDAHIVFSSTESPDWLRENVYEILVGGWGNERTLIRRKRQDIDMTVEYTSNVLQKNDILQLLIEITNEGKIQVFIENQKEPLATAVDAQGAIPIKYFGFASYDDSLATFFYGCQGDNVFQKGKLNNQSPLQPQAKANAKDEMSPVDLRNFLVTKCRYYSVKYDTADYDYKDYIKISDIRNSQPDDYILRIVLFIRGGRDANILLTTSDHPNFERDFVYEFVIGGWGNERTQVRKKKGSVVLADVNESGILDKDRPLKFLLEIAHSGSIRLYAERRGSKPLISIFEENPLPIQYMSFSSWSHSEVQFYYNCRHINTTDKSIMN